MGHDCPERESLQRMSRTLGVMVAVVVLGFSGVTAQLVDVDGDGYYSVESGGNDCVDSLMSVYKMNPVCNESAAPTLIQPPPTVDTPGWSGLVADHAWIQDTAGTYHLFAHTHGISAGVPAFVVHHVANPDLTSVAPHSHIRAVEAGEPGSWDADGLWAPFVIKEGGIYFMFYTGVTGSGASHVERIGLATSTDLASWTKVPSVCPGISGPGCVYECRADWTTWGQSDPPADYDYQCRDPFVIKVPEENRWLLFASSKLKAIAVPPLGEAAGITAAESTNLAGGAWSSVGYVEATRWIPEEFGGVGNQAQPSTGDNIAENSFVAEFDGLYYLFFTDWRDPQTGGEAMTQYATSPVLALDRSGSVNWQYRGSIPEAGVNTTEVIRHGGDTWIMSNARVNIWDIRLKRVVWNPNTASFSFRNLTKLSCRVTSASIHPGAPEVCGDGLNNDCDGFTDEGCGTPCRDCPEFESP